MRLFKHCDEYRLHLDGTFTEARQLSSDEAKVTRCKSGAIEIELDNVIVEIEQGEHSITGSDGLTSLRVIAEGKTAFQCSVTEVVNA